MLIREAQPDDAPGIARVHIGAWLETYRGLVPDAYLDELAHAHESRTLRWQRILSTDDSKTFVLASDDGQVVGFASGGAVRTEDSPYTGELYSLYVLRRAQKSGMGRALVGRFARWLHENAHDSMLVWVLEANPARGFYERLGGEYWRSLPFEIAGVPLIEVGYGWASLARLLPTSQS